MVITEEQKIQIAPSSRPVNRGERTAVQPRPTAEALTAMTYIAKAEHIVALEQTKYPSLNPNQLKAAERVAYALRENGRRPEETVSLVNDLKTLFG